jgi:hypothetical protein
LISHYYANKIYWRIIEGDSTTAVANEWRLCSGSFLLVLQWRRRTVGPRSKIPPKIQKLVKLTGHTNASNSLTSFQYEVHTLVGNGNIVNLLNFAWEKLVKSHQVNLLFLAVLCHLEPLCGGGGFILKQRSWIHPGATIFLISDSR